MPAAFVTVACLAVLTACGDDSAAVTSTDPVEVKVGEAFEWNGFAIEEGWRIIGVDRAVDMETVTTPEVSGTIVNQSERKRVALFQLVFSTGGEPVATVNCSAARMITGQAKSFLCPGINTTMPQDYDAVVVQEFTRETTPDTSSS